MSEKTPSQNPETNGQLPSNVPPPISEQKPAPSKKETIQGCGCLILLAIAAAFFLKGCFGGGATADETPIERKLAFLDSGVSADEDSALAAEYKVLLSELAEHFGITEKEVGNMTYVVVKDLQAKHGSTTTTLEMMRAVHQMATSKNGNMLGKGKENYASAVAMLAAQMIGTR